MIGKHISKTIGALYTAYQRNGILPAKSLSEEIPNILYFDWNTNRKKSIFQNAYSKDVNLFILHMLGTLGFVNYYLARILPEDNCWLFRVRYITTYYVLLGVEKLANFLRTEIGKDDLIVRSSEALIKQRSSLFVSPFRNCMMHYDLIPNEESIIKQEYLDKDKKFFGLVESCYNGLGFFDFNLRLQSFTQDLIELLEGQVIINKEGLKLL